MERPFGMMSRVQTRSTRSCPNETWLSQYLKAQLRCYCCMSSAARNLSSDRRSIAIILPPRRERTPSLEMEVFRSIMAYAASKKYISDIEMFKGKLPLDKVRRGGVTARGGPPRPPPPAGGGKENRPPSPPPRPPHPLTTP